MSFEDSLRHDGFRKNSSRFHVGKRIDGGYVLTNPSNSSQKYAGPNSDKHIANCRFHYKTIILMLERGDIFIIDCVKNGTGEVLIKELGNLETCKLLVETWWFDGCEDELIMLKKFKDSVFGGDKKSKDKCKNDDDDDDEKNRKRDECDKENEDKDADDDDDDDYYFRKFDGICPICHYVWGKPNIELVTGFGCGHFYHQCCWRTSWFRKHATCLLCDLVKSSTGCNK